MQPIASGSRISSTRAGVRPNTLKGGVGSSLSKGKGRAVEELRRENPEVEERLPILPESEAGQGINQHFIMDQGDQVVPPGGNINPNLNPNLNPPAPPAPPVVQAQVMERRYPAPWDVNRPKLSRVPDVGEIKLFWDHIDGIWSTRPQADDQVKKARTLEFVDQLDLKDQWRGMAEYGLDYTYDQWKEAIMKFYPEIEELVSGSVFKLKDLCLEAKGIERKDLGPFRRFAMAFNNEALKLLNPPAQVTNRDLVHMILNTLDSDFAKEVEVTLNQPSAADIIGINSELRLAPPSDIIQQAMAAQLNRRGDKFTYIQVLKVIDYAMSHWSGRSAMDNLSTTGGRDKGIIPIGSLLDDSANPQLSSSNIRLKSHQNRASRGIKPEPDDRLEFFAQEMALMKDTMELQEKKMQSSVKQLSDTMENSMKSLAQYLKPQREAPRVEFKEQRSGEGTRKGPCFFCHGPHLISECESKDEFIRLGWLSYKDGKMMMGDGSWIPRYPEDVSRMDKIERFYNNKGITRESAIPRKSTMMMGYDSYEDAGAYDRVDHLYDYRDDEMRAQRVQQGLQQNRVGYQVPNRYQAGQPNMDPSPQNRGYTIQQRPVQQQMAQQIVDRSSVVPGMDMSQLIQLIDTVRGSNNANRGPSIEQNVQTRTGAGEDSATGSGF